MSTGQDEHVAPEPAEPALPAPVQTRRAHISLWLIWLIPVLAVAVGVGLAVNALTNHGPTITVVFRNGDGIEAGKTRIKLKEVDVGIVKAVRLSNDLQQVEVIAELRPGPSVEALLKSDTRYWVVRPRVGLGGISGLNTLLSGAYIGVDPGRADTSATTFQGLDSQPPITADVPGTSYTLVGDDLGSLDIGSGVYYRRVPVGQISDFRLAPDGQRIIFTIFVAAPYDRFITRGSRFWQASGIDVGLDAQGFRVEAQSVASILAGGIAFQEGPKAESSEVPSQPAPLGTEFRLYAKQGEAMRRPDGVGFDYRLLFNGSVRGLTVGAPVDFRGLSIGEVTRIAVDSVAGQRNPNPRIAVDIRVFPTRLPTIDGTRVGDTELEQQRSRLDPMVAKGFRAQLRSANLLTGQLFVALDFVANAAPAKMDWRAQPPVLPTVTGGFDDLQETLTSIAHKIDALPLDSLTRDVQANLASLNVALKRADSVLARVDGELTPALRDTLTEAREAMKELRQALGTADRTLSTSTQTLVDVQRAARSLRNLADYLEQHPESLLRGKSEDAR